MTTEEFQDQAEETVRSLPETAKMVIMQPTAFFRTMPRSGGFFSPLIFMLVMSVIYAVIATVVSVVSFGWLGMASIFTLILTPIFAIIGVFITAAIVCVIWMMMGSKEKFEASFRIVCYCAAIWPIGAVLGLIPYVGVAAWLIWGIWLMILASVHIHQIAQKTATVVFGIIGLVLLLLTLGGQYAGQQSMQQLEDLQGQFEGLDPNNPEDAAKMLEKMMELQQQEQQQQ